MYEQFYRSLYRIRRTEEEIARIYPTDKLKSPVHLSIGQEAISVAVCESLTQTDVVFGTYRGHAMYLAKGGSLKGMIAEMYGKQTGCTGGKGGSMHLVDTEAGVMGTSAVVGTTIANAVGYAQAMKSQGKDTIVACFFGDGATEEGVFYESLNYAALKKLPVFFICENNGYAIHTHQSKRQGVPDIASRAAAFGVNSTLVDDNDAIKLHDQVTTAVEEIRSGEATGPYLFECRTYRWKEHVGPGEDWHLGFRVPDEAKPWVENDQVARIGELVPAVARAAIEAEVETEIAEAIEFAENSPFPEEAELFTNVYSTPVVVPVREAA